MLSPDQIHTLLDILDRQLIFFAARNIGPSVLNDSERTILQNSGIDVDRLITPDTDLVSLNFHLGILSNILGDERVNKLTYQELINYIERGNYIPLTAKEKAVIQSIQMQSMADIRSLRGRIFQDINNVVGSEFAVVRSNQEEFMRQIILNDTASRQSRRNIARKIAGLTGDWSRNFDKSVQYISHTALNEGRLAMIERRAEEVGKPPRAYFQVQIDACDHCKKAYLKKDGEPKIFTIKQLQVNGTNIGRKQKDWLPTISALHPHCRCLLTEYIEGSVWNGTWFVLPKQTQPKINRPKIRVVINNEEYYV